MDNLQLLGCAVGLAIAMLVKYVIDLMIQRSDMEGLPQPPMKNLLVGHLHIAAELQRIFPERLHPHVYADYLRTKYDLPETFYLDMRPFGGVCLYSCDPELSSTYFTTGQSLPKSSLAKKFLQVMLGKNNLVTVEGNHWKHLRSMFNPGYASSNIVTMSDLIVDYALIFKEVLGQKAKEGNIFQLEDAATMLTMDIIGRVTLDINMDSQRKRHPIPSYFIERTSTMRHAGAVFPWEDLDFTRPYKLWRNKRLLDAAIMAAVDDKIIRRANDELNTKHNRKASVLDLALSAYEDELAVSAKGDKPKKITRSDQLSSRMRQDIIDSIKTFFFAGHDTSSSTLCYAMYLLHRNPEKCKILIEELNEYYPPGTDTAAAIRSNPHSINKLEYLNAVIKEALRLFPPVSTVREFNKGDKYLAREAVDVKTGTKYPLDLPNIYIWPASTYMHRNIRFFPKPNEFIPERHIKSLTPFPDCELFEVAGKDAFRPFEKGPRNCIGQELAMVEMKIALALTVREFDFVLEFEGEEADLQYPIPESTVAELDEKTEYGKMVRTGGKPNRWEGHRLYQILKVTASPVGGCPGRVYIRK